MKMERMRLKKEKVTNKEGNTFILKRLLVKEEVNTGRFNIVDSTQWKICSQPAG